MKGSLDLKAVLTHRLKNAALEHTAFVTRIDLVTIFTPTGLVLLLSFCLILKWFPVIQVGLELLILQILPAESWDDRHKPHASLVQLSSVS